MGTWWASPPISLSENVCPHGGCWAKRVWPGNLRGCQEPLPERDLWAEVPTMELLTHETTWEEIMGIYHQVYQLRRKPREVPCSQDTAEETHMEILEMLKEHLWCMWGSTQPEEPRQRPTGARSTRTPAQAAFHAQLQVTYDHFGHFLDRLQESWEESLRVTRDAHCWVLAMAAMLEGHIEQLSCSISQGWHGIWG